MPTASLFVFFFSIDTLSSTRQCGEQRVTVTHNQLLNFRNEIQGAAGKML